MWRSESHVQTRWTLGQNTKVKTTCVSDIFDQKLKSRYRESKKPLKKTKRQWVGGEIEVEEKKNNKGGFQQTGGEI